MLSCKSRSIQVIENEPNGVLTAINLISVPIIGRAAVGNLFGLLKNILVILWCLLYSNDSDYK
ncbi:MAG: hypothetical protein IPK86_00060 [Neisseriales bacterium]|nr:MAG: hypothetical protein IPK86_00060 [Neisseriales bacterium]